MSSRGMPTFVMFFPENRMGSPDCGLPILLLLNRKVRGLWEVVAEGGPEHVVDALGADTGSA